MLMVSLKILLLGTHVYVATTLIVVHEMHGRVDPN